MSERKKAYFARLDDLGNGERAALKRGAGTMLADADGKALTVFYRCLPPTVPEWEADRWFAAGCIHCLWPPEEQETLPLEELIGRLMRSGELSDSTAHRVETLIDMPWDQDGFLLAKLCRLIKMVKQKSSVRMDHEAFLQDLMEWDWVSQKVQRKWARAIFTEKSERSADDVD